MPAYSAIIVDDEVPQQKILSDMLNEFQDYTISKICSGVDDALIHINQLKPDLVLLDVVMPPKSGFDLLSSLKVINFEIIFTTSFEEYAIKAFKVSAVDYLLKPFDKNDLALALEKFESRIKLKQSSKHIQTLLQNINEGIHRDNTIALPVLSGYNFVKIDNIIRCEADDMYTTFFLTDGTKIVVSKNIKECEILLSEYGFFRCHISHLINMNYIKQYIKGDGGQVRMSDDSIVDVSRRKKEEFLKLLKRI